jgi:hypothetical protein
VWDATLFTKNRDLLLEAAVAKEFLAQVVERTRAAGEVRHILGLLSELPLHNEERLRPPVPYQSPPTI